MGQKCYPKSIGRCVPCYAWPWFWQKIIEDTKAKQTTKVSGEEIIWKMIALQLNGFLKACTYCSNGLKCRILTWAYGWPCCFYCQSNEFSMKGAASQLVKKKSREKWIKRVKNWSKRPLNSSWMVQWTRPMVAAMDEKINHYFDGIGWLQKKSRKIRNAISLQAVLLQVIAERIGDYAKNICEWVVLLWNR